MRQAAGEPEGSPPRPLMAMIAHAMPTTPRAMKSVSSHGMRRFAGSEEDETGTAAILLTCNPLYLPGV